MVVAIGSPYEGLMLDDALLRSPLPPVGALVYPRYRVATVATTGVIEFHCLGEDVHCAVDAAAWWASLGLAPPAADMIDLRGAWDDDGRFYVCGIALTDWLSEYDAVQRAAFQRRLRARARGLRVFGGPRLGIGGRHGGAG